MFRRTARIGLAAVVLALLAMLFLVPAHSADKGDQNTTGRISVSRSKREMKVDYLPIAGFGANGGTGAVNPRLCRAANYCDTIRVDINPEGTNESHQVRAILTWSNPSSYDLDLGAWTPAFDAAGNETTAASGSAPPIRDCKTVGKNHPESCPVTADVPTDRLQSQNYWYLLVNNLTDPDDAGVDLLGYRITVQMSFEDFEEFPIDEDDFFGGGKGGAFDPSTDLNFDESGGLSLDSDEVPEVEASPISLPGSDGPLSDFDIDVLGQSAEQQQKSSPLIPLVIAFLVLAAGSTTFFFLRNRRRSEVSEQS